MVPYGKKHTQKKLIKKGMGVPKLSLMILTEVQSINYLIVYLNLNYL